MQEHAKSFDDLIEQIIGYFEDLAWDKGLVDDDQYIFQDDDIFNDLKEYIKRNIAVIKPENDSKEGK